MYTRLLTAIFILLISKTLSSQAFLTTPISFPQEINVLQDCLTTIEQQSNIQFSFSSNLEQLDQEVFIENAQTNVEDFLNDILPFYGINFLVKRNQKILLFNDTSRRNDNYTFFGKVIDDETSEPISNVLVMAGEYIKYTDDHGYFSFRFTAKDDLVNSLFCSIIGYNDQNFLINPQSNVITIKLQHSNLLDTIVIQPLANPRIFPSFLPTETLLEAEDLSNTPGITGRRDIISSTKKLASVDSGGEGTHGLFVRGGSADQNLILVDNIAVYEFSHVGGISSIFLPEILQNAKFSSSGFSAEYGGKLSSVIDINLKEGNKQTVQGSFGLGLDGLSGSIEGPMNNGKTSYLFSGRISTLDLITKPLISELLDFEDSSINFYDLYGKVTHYFTPYAKISATGYIGNDNIRLISDEQISTIKPDSILKEKNFNDIRWGNKLIGLNYHQLIKKMHMDIYANYSQYQFTSRGSFERALLGPPDEVQFAYDIYSRSKNEDYTAKIKFKYPTQRIGELLFGGEYNYQIFSPVIGQEGAYLGLKPNEIESFLPNYQSKNFASYLELKKHILKFITFRSGLRYSRNFGENFIYQFLEPRISISYLGENLWVEAMASVMHQNVHLLLNPGVGLPSDLWFPSNEYLRPQRAIEFSVSTNFKLTEQQTVKLNIYNKWYNDLIEYENPTDLFYNVVNGIPADTSAILNLEDEIVVGIGDSRGFELSFDHNSSKINWFFNYKLNFSNRQFDEIDEGEPFAFRYDRRHDLNMGFNYKLKSNQTLRINWVIGSGYKYTIADVEFFLGQQQIREPQFRNNGTLPPFHHLDINYSLRKSVGNKAILELNMGVYNVYNNKNPFYAYESDNLELKDGDVRIISIFPIIPNFNAIYKW